MKICVTGAAGRIGTFVCDSVIAAGHELVATDLRTSPELPYRIAIADLLRREQCYPLLEGCDALIHLGNHPSHWGRDAQTVYAENCAMNINAFQAAWEQGVRRIVFASSIQVAAGGRTSMEPDASALAYLPLDGESPPRMNNVYASSKDAAEGLLRCYASTDPDARCVALRFPAMWSKAYERRSELRRARAETMDEAFAWILGADAGRLAVAAAESEIPGYRCYQGGSHLPALDLPVSEIVERWFQGVPLRQPASELSGLVDLEPLRRDLGWTPTRELEWVERGRRWG